MSRAAVTWQEAVHNRVRTRGRWIRRGREVDIRSGMSTSRALCPERLLYQANPSEMFREKQRRMVKTCPCSSKTGAELADLSSRSPCRAGHIVISQSFRFICVRKRLLKCCPQRTARLFGFSWTGCLSWRVSPLSYLGRRRRSICINDKAVHESPGRGPPPASSRSCPFSKFRAILW